MIPDSKVKVHTSTAISDHPSVDHAEQARKQCRLAQRMAEIITNLAATQVRLLDYAPDKFVEIVGFQSHTWINNLSDMINTLDAATPEDEAMAAPIFAGARRLFPLCLKPIINSNNGEME